LAKPPADNGNLAPIADAGFAPTRFDPFREVQLSR
jgi:hypothetical protein